MERMTIFSLFWDLESKNVQDIHLQNHITVEDVKRRTAKDEDGHTSDKRSVSFHYYVKVSGSLIEVCKVAYCNIYGVTPDRVRRLCNHLKVNKVPEDLRGRAPAKHAIPGETCRLIEEHIKSFPPKNSHYSQREICYLSADLTVKKMHQLFQEKHPEVKVNYWLYYKIFKERFNLRFGRPQVDTCVTCESLNTKIKSPALNEVARRSAVAELIVHKRKSKKFYHKLDEVRNKCQSDDSIAGLCFDFMMCVQLPDIPVQDIFYYRQLTVNMFCITNLKDNSSKLYVYHEGICHKGPNEVTSFIHEYVNTELNDRVKTLFLFSDNCGGQNKNHTIVRYCNALVENARFEEVQQYYPVRGHSFLPCDRAFGIIKRALKRIDRIYTIYQLTEILVHSSKKFSVHMVQREDVLNFKNWWRSFYKLSCMSDASYGTNVARKNKVQFKISQFAEFIHTREKTGKVLCKTSIGGLMAPESFTLRIPERSIHPVKQLSMPTETAYKSKVPMNAKKICDLQKILQYVPYEFSSFYEEIVSWPTTEEDVLTDVEES